MIEVTWWQLAALLVLGPWVWILAAAAVGLALGPALRDRDRA